MMKPKNPMILLAALGLVFMVNPAEGEARKVVEDERFRAERLPQKAACCPAELAWRITDKVPGEERLITLTGRVEEVRDFFFAGDKLVVEGRLRYGGSNLLIADLDTGTQEEEIWNYGHAFSPSGRYLVYRSHYPRLGMPEGRRSLLVLYDLESGPEGNRFGQERAMGESPGLPIYPELNAERLSFDVTLASDRLWVSPFLWAEDETSVVFFECATDWSSCGLVTVGLGSDVFRGAAAARSQRTVLDLHPFTRSEGPWTFTGGPDEPVRLAVRSLAWAEEGRGVVVEPEPASSLIDRFELPLP